MKPTFNIRLCAHKPPLRLSIRTLPFEKRKTTRPLSVAFVDRCLCQPVETLICSFLFSFSLITIYALKFEAQSFEVFMQISKPKLVIQGRHCLIKSSNGLNSQSWRQRFSSAKSTTEHTELLKTGMLSIIQYICRNFLALMDSMLADIRAYFTGGIFLSNLYRSLLSMVSRLLIRKM